MSDNPNYISNGYLFPSGALLASGYFLPSGNIILSKYSLPSGYSFPSGYLLNSGHVHHSGFFSYNNLSGVFSNALQSQSSGIYNFTIFNPYVHYYAKPASLPSTVNTSVNIPFLSDYRIADTFDPYKRIG